jgi:hypothetical protein
VLGRAVSAVCALALTLILLLGLSDETLLVSLSVGGHSLLSLAALLGVLLAAARAASSGPAERWHGALCPEEAFAALCSRLLHVPAAWRAAPPRAASVRRQVSAACPYSAELLLREMLSPLTLPLLCRAHRRGGG